MSSPRSTSDPIVHGLASIYNGSELACARIVYEFDRNVGRQMLLDVLDHPEPPYLDQAAVLVIILEVMGRPWIEKVLSRIDELVTRA